MKMKINVHTVSVLRGFMVDCVRKSWPLVIMILATMRGGV
jgi:hypothetical protein